MPVFVQNPYPDCPDEESILENCSCCRRECNTWYYPLDIALCENCAKIVNHEDLPTKIDWIIKEQILDDD